MVEYTLRAQFTPSNPKAYVYDPLFTAAYSNVSMFRGSRKVFVYRPMDEMPESKNFKMTMTKQVGGLGIKLFGSSECVMDVWFNKNEYWPGE